MTDVTLPFIASLLCGVIVLLLIQSVLLLRTMNRLTRLENSLTRGTGSAVAGGANALSQEVSDEAMQVSAFQTFLEENPERYHLPKREQFAAYREWRQARGLNWSSDRKGEKI